MNPAAPVAPAKKIKVLIITMDSGTSERWACEAEVDEITPTQILRAYEAKLAEDAGEMASAWTTHHMETWLPRGDRRVPKGPHLPITFIAKADDPYFGPIRVVGFVEEVK